MKKGMNPELVAQMGQQITQAGEDAMAAYTEVAGRVEGLDWTGEDRDRYVSDFSSTVQNLVQQLQTQCAEFGERARTNADQQRTASS
ncbi:MAG: hypothetical protein GX960_02175 [Actinomycetales bacterium]|nr:hypothetical protein [Actinomycetales bacterium]